jgi:hypothetical protein
MKVHFGGKKILFFDEKRKNRDKKTKPFFK